MAIAEALRTDTAAPATGEDGLSISDAAPATGEDGLRTSDAAPATGEDGLSISDAARATGVSAHTLRYYERAGLMLDRVGRASSSHRRYTEEEIRWVVLLTKLRSTGMPIRRMREYADLVRAGGGNERERLALLEAHRLAVRAQLDAMERNLAAIDHKIAFYRERTST